MKTIAILVALTLAPALFAADVESLLDNAAAVKAGDSKAWLEARDKLVALGADALPALRAAGADEKWTADGWVRAMVAQGCVLRLESADLAAEVDSPKGLNPEHYKLARKPEPYCQMELARRGSVITPLLLERWRWTFESFPYSTGADGKAERECFGKALLFAPGQTADVRARFALEAALRDGTLPEEWRQHAAVSFGQTGGKAALEVLTELFDDEKQPAGVREGCGWAIGRVAAVESAEALKVRLAADGLTVELKRALLTGVGILGSVWGWKSRGVMHQLEGEQVREQCADMLVEAIKTMPLEANAISNALSLTAWDASVDAVQELVDNGETAEIRDAAKTCIEPLKIAVARNKK
jgi:hypothetical protein